MSLLSFEFDTDPRLFGPFELDARGSCASTSSIVFVAPASPPFLLVYNGANLPRATHRSNDSSAFELKDTFFSSSSWLTHDGTDSGMLS